MHDMWTFRDYESFRDTPLTGFKVEALDGEIGSIDEATLDAGQSFIVVDTGPWIFGKKVLLPAGLIDRVNLPDRRVVVNRSKEEIKNAPEWDETRYLEPTYRSEIGTYYESRTPAGTGTRGQVM
jgi:hypothetical protein